MLDNADDQGAHQYQSQWQNYRERRTRLGVLVLVEFLAFIPFVALVEKALRHVLPAGNSAFLTAGFMFGAIYLYTGSRLRTFPCPRCGENFFGGFFATPKTMLGPSCANCGLRKYDGE
jgi:hypothetical protein